MKKKLILITPILIAVIAFFFVYRYYNHEDNKTSLTVAEKKWVQNNKTKTIDIELINDYPIYGVDGEGVLYDFVNDIRKNIGLEFNEISYLKAGEPTTKGLRFRILDNDDNLSDKDLVLFNDYYIAVGKNYERINHIRDMKNITFGVFESDSDIISYYLKSGTNIAFKKYQSIDQIYNALDIGEVNMIIIPNIMYLNKTIDSSKYSINYYFTEINKKMVLTLTDDEELNSVITKYFNKWKDTKFISEYDNHYFDYYLSRNGLTAKEKASLVSKVYTYGYVENSPYEKMVNNRVAGIAGIYLDRISRLSKIEFKYQKYDNFEELKEAIQNKEIDMYFDYYGLDNSNYKPTLSTFIEDYVILGKSNSNYIINSFESIRNENVSMLENDSLYSFVNNNGKAHVKTCSSIDDFYLFFLLLML